MSCYKISMDTFASVKSMFCRRNPSSCLINNIISAVHHCRIYTEPNKYEQQQQKKPTENEHSSIASTKKKQNHYFSLSYFFHFLSGYRDVFRIHKLMSDYMKISTAIGI